jgi:Zn-dependent protease
MGFDVLYLVIVFCVVLGSMILHELMHGLVAYWLGDDTAKVNGRLSLNPLRHIDWYMSVLLPMLLALSGGPIFGGAKPVPINTTRLKWGEWGFALVAIAGPLTNFLLAMVSFAVLYYAGPWLPVGVVTTVLAQMVVVNLGFCVFNLIPVPPLDGSRVLYALAPDMVRRWMEGIERYGIFVVLVLVLVFQQQMGQILIAAQSGILQFFEWLIV